MTSPMTEDGAALIAAVTYGRFLHNLLQRACTSEGWVGCWGTGVDVRLDFREIRQDARSRSRVQLGRSAPQRPPLLSPWQTRCCTRQGARRFCSSVILFYFWRNEFRSIYVESDLLLGHDVSLHNSNEFDLSQG